MRFDSEHHHRRSIRLRGYDYALAGVYSVTIVAQDRACLFGEVVDGVPRLSEMGLTMESWWNEVRRAFPGVELDTYVVMPNHIHGIIMIGARNVAETAHVEDEGDKDQGRHAGLPLQESAPHVVGADLRVCPAHHPNVTRSHRASLPNIIQWFKTMSTNDYIRGVKHYEWPPFNKRLWQRNYYEQIIRNDHHLDRIRAYIDGNPARWADDPDNPRFTAAPRGRSTTIGRF